MRRLLASTRILAILRKDYLAVALVLVSLLSLTSVYRPRHFGTGEHHAAKSQATPTQQRNLKTTTFESAAPTQVFIPMPASVYVRQPLHADRTFSPRRLPGAYFNRPPPSALS